MEIVINNKHGGFGLSHKATFAYAKRKGIKLYATRGLLKEEEIGEDYEEPSNRWEVIHYYTVPPEQYKSLERDVKKNDDNYKRLNEKNWYFSCGDIPRNDPDLIAVVKEMKKEANGMCASLKIVDIPDGIDWKIEEYDGLEWVSEEHRTWA